ncbi:hypothetical protein CWE21_12385 [Pseudidiomarina aquimaris]|uniref:PQ-loop repeat-containing protein n=1 Tax=Pseudidiomarina aquimaris TaxID=641841 RepID=A0A432XBP8_9GAMM|nr:hypothetical protein [Pseudidiomarina aquimaris]RUO46174.1 hypothetical protein CWE21_12385 [Pseudidiomarina aquimaris]
MNLYTFTGLLNSILIVVSLIGVYAQLKTIWDRKQQNTSTGEATLLLSLNQFSVSFLAYLSFFVYGYSISPFNHYIVWPRLTAALLVGMILFEIWRDRKTKTSFVTFTVALTLIGLATIGLCLGKTIADQGRYISTTLIIVISVMIAQGYYHQIKLIYNSGSTGAVNIRMSQFILLMDVSTIAFALTMGFADGWPLLVLATTSAITKLVIMYLFRWVRTSPLAQQRRVDTC